MLGHIRDASPSVPVNSKNAHPFKLENITFVHNGKLTPLKETDFVVDEWVLDMDTKTGKPFKDKNGNDIQKKVRRSDSLVFFEEFIKDWQADTTTYATEEEKFIAVVNETMSKFYGKFAMVFIINGTFYICRGKTADLHITYMTQDEDKDSKVIGWAINTSNMTLDVSTTLLSNIHQVSGKGLYFTYPKLLDEETIYVAEDLGLRKIGKVTEWSAPVVQRAVNSTQYPITHAGSSTNFTKPGEKKSPEDERLIRVTAKIYKWMEDYSMSPQDIQFLLYSAFYYSTLDVNVKTLEVFYDRVLVKLSNRTNKDIRKAIRRKIHAYIGVYDYQGFEAYPWMLNNKANQRKFADK
jgi:hypothetical protein